MLESLNDVSDLVILEDSSFYAWFKASSHSYVSIHPRNAVITKSEGKYHLIEFREEDPSLIATTLKVISYVTLVLPLIAYTLNICLFRHRSDHKYFYYNSKGGESAFLNAFQRRDLTTMKALYTFDPLVVTDINSEGKSFLQIGRKDDLKAFVKWVKENNQKIEIDWVSTEEKIKTFTERLVRDIKALAQRNSEEVRTHQESLKRAIQAIVNHVIVEYFPLDEPVLRQ